MDWNKSNTILIIAFVVINIFLFATDSINQSNDEQNVYEDKQFIENVENQLKSKNINIKCDIPKEIYILPVLEAEYHIVEVDDQLVQNYLGSDVKAVKDVYNYTNISGESLDIVDGKKIIYTMRQKIPAAAEDFNNEEIKNSINKFFELKKINSSDYINTENYIYNDYQIISYVQNYDDLSLENSYMSFFVDKEGIYKFEMQKISSVKEIKVKVRTTTSYEALLRLMSNDNLKNKDIVGIKMTYYSLENENWKYITRMNADPTWKVIFSDGTNMFLTSLD